MKKSAIFTDGLFRNNPALVQLIGLCSVLGVSNTVQGAFGMGMAVIFVLTASNVVISLLRSFIPDEIRIPAFIVVIAGFVTILEMVMEAYLPEIYNLLGIFLPLIVVNCIILGRAEAFASKNGIVDSIIDGLGNGLGYTWVITGIAIIRELLGTGALLGNQIIPEEFAIPFFQQVPSSFMLLGFFIAASNAIRSAKKRQQLTPHITETKAAGGAR